MSSAQHSPSVRLLTSNGLTTKQPRFSGITAPFACMCVLSRLAALFALRRRHLSKSNTIWIQSRIDPTNWTMTINLIVQSGISWIQSPWLNQSSNDMKRFMFFNDHALTVLLRHWEGWLRWQQNGLRTVTWIECSKVAEIQLAASSCWISCLL